MEVTEHELRQRLALLQDRLDACDSLLRRIKPATLDRGFWSTSLVRLCEDAQDLIDSHAQEPRVLYP